MFKIISIPLYYSPSLSISRKNKTRYIFLILSTDLPKYIGIINNQNQTRMKVSIMILAIGTPGRKLFTD